MVSEQSFEGVDPDLTDDLEQIWACTYGFDSNFIFNCHYAGVQ